MMEEQKDSAWYLENLECPPIDLVQEWQNKAVEGYAITEANRDPRLKALYARVATLARELGFRLVREMTEAPEQKGRHDGTCPDCAGYGKHEEGCPHYKAV